MGPGIYNHLTNAEYHGGEGVSNSMLKMLREQSPMHLKAKRDAANDNEEQSPALFIGTAFHCLVLEPEAFVREYTLALRQSDVPDAIDDRDVLVSMVEKINEGRQAKLPTSGSKADQIARIKAADESIDDALLEGCKGSELKLMLDALNMSRLGLLSTSGTRHELAELLRANGVAVTLWSDVKEEWLRNNGHRNVLTEEQWVQLHAMRDAVLAHPAARLVLTGAKYVTEYSAYANDPQTGELVRVRPDLWRFDGIVADLKTTDDASLEGFARSIAKYGYDIQHPFYLDTLNQALAQAGKQFGDVKHPKSATAFVFIAVEKKFPYAVEVYVLDSASVDVGRAKYREALATYSVCRKTDTWPGYSDGSVQKISLPQWHMSKHAHLVDAA